jgi:hypothetical protein
MSLSASTRSEIEILSDDAAMEIISLSQSRDALLAALQGMIDYHGCNIANQEMRCMTCNFAREMIAQSDRSSGTNEEEADLTPDQCCECDLEAIGYSEGSPYCAAHYRARPRIDRPSEEATT